MSGPRIRDKRDRLRQLRAFCEALRRGSISRAAEHLGLTQPAVSLNVRDLEHELGEALLVRTTAGVEPTPAGERLHALADPLVRDADSLLGDFARHLDLAPPDGVRVASSNAGAAFVLPAYLKRFRDAHPDIAVRLDAATVPEGFKRLADDEVDFVVGPRERFDEERIVYRELRTYRIVLITPLDHPLAGRETVSPCEVHTWPAVVVPPGLYTRQDGETVAHALGLDVSAVIEVGEWGVLKRYVEAGFGVAAVPSLIVNSTDRVSVASLAGPLPERSYGVYTYRDRTLTPSARRLCGMLIAGIPASYHSDGSPVR